MFRREGCAWTRRPLALWRGVSNLTAHGTNRCGGEAQTCMFFPGEGYYGARPFPGEPGWGSNPIEGDVHARRRPAVYKGSSDSSVAASLWLGVREGKAVAESMVGSLSTEMWALGKCR